MNLFQMIAVLFVLAALFSYVNHRYVRLPTTIGLMAMSLVFSLVLIGLDHFNVRLPGNDMTIGQHAAAILKDVQFSDTLLHGMLAFLLFAGALHVKIENLENQKWVISLLATVGVAASTFIIGGVMYLVLNGLGLELQFLHCLLFGALISPTDPIAVLGILKTVGAPKSLETQIVGESLFNDGIGVVVFLVLVNLATGHGHASFGGVAMLLLEEAVGGAVFGFAIGWIAYYMLKEVDNYQVEVLVTLALVTGGYALAEAIHTSGPIAIVVAGLLIGNHGRRFAMSPTVRKHLDMFWELIDEILNAVLFVLIGLEVLVMRFEPVYLLAGIIAILVVLGARFVSVGGTVSALRFRRNFTKGTVPIMTWAGLRGGISVALALSLRHNPNLIVPHLDALLAITYIVVVFSIIVQGTTVGTLVRRLTAENR